jgi:cyclomaltodextrinase
MNIHTPEWVKHAVFYQIFPDRFCRSRRTVHPRGIHFKSWGSPPEEQGYQGGDLFGIVDKLDYIKDLGITALYLNPIFSAASNHRYNAYDYLKVDPLLGGEEALRELIDEAHLRGIRIVLDGVFNHCGRGFWAFHHLLENGGNSPYSDWFTVYEYPLNPYPDGKEIKDPNYAAWWKIAALPKLNTENPGVRDYLLQITRYWLEFGIDGWRLDVPQEINDDQFWRDFRKVVKSVNPEAYIVGEIWHEARHWLQGDMFDAVMNYQITGPIMNFFGSDNLNLSWSHTDVALKPGNAITFRRQVEAMFALYDWEIHYAQLNMLDSHDMPRALWLLNGDKSAFCLAVLCQMTMPGAPCVYYGDEIGLSSGGDPFCRGAFPWDQEEVWDHKLKEYYHQVIHLRHTHPVLRTGQFSFLFAQDMVVVYRRSIKDEEVIVAFNAGKQPKTIQMPGSELTHRTYTSIWPTEANEVLTNSGNLSLSLSAQSALILSGME